MRRVPAVRPRILRADERHRHACPQELHRPRGRAPGRAARPRHRTTRSVGSPVGPASPASGPARRREPSSSGVLGPGAIARRGRRAPRRRRLPRRGHRAGHPPADEPRRRGRPGGGGQAAHLQGDRPGPPGGRTSATTGTSLPPGDRDRSTTPRSTRSSTSCATRTPTLAPVEDRGARRATTRHRLRGHPRRRAVRGRHRPSGCR